MHPRSAQSSDKRLLTPVPVHAHFPCCDPKQRGVMSASRKERKQSQKCEAQTWEDGVFADNGKLCLHSQVKRVVPLLDSPFSKALRIEKLYRRITLSVRTMRPSACKTKLWNFCGAVVKSNKTTKTRCKPHIGLIAFKEKHKFITNSNHHGIAAQTTIAGCKLSLTKAAQGCWLAVENRSGQILSEPRACTQPSVRNDTKLQKGASWPSFRYSCLETFSIPRLPPNRPA